MRPLQNCSLPENRISNQYNCPKPGCLSSTKQSHLNKIYRKYRGQSAVETIAETPVTKADTRFVRYLKTHTLTGFDKHSIYDVGKYFLRGLFKENLNLRASSLSFNFFLSLFPILIFLLTTIAALPVKGLKTRLIKEISVMLPEASSKALSGTIFELLNHPNHGLLSFGFILALYFASNAYHTMINSFNRRLPVKVRRNWIQNRIRAIYLTLMITGLAIVVLYILTQFYQADNYMYKHHWDARKFFRFLITIFEYLILIVFVLVAISCMYYFGPANKKRWKFFSAGSIFATSLSVLSTFFFSVYVNNFNSYNKVYGSIGAIIALMILIYINTLVVLVGFELNTSIDRAHINAKEISQLG